MSVMWFDKGLDSMGYTDLMLMQNVSNRVFSVNEVPVRFDLQGEVLWTTSLVVADVFDKRHSDVLRDIDKHIKELTSIFEEDFDEVNKHNFVFIENEVNKRNFAFIDYEQQFEHESDKNHYVKQQLEKYFIVSEYIDERGRSKRMIKLSRKGFSLVAMSFTGSKAERWKIQYIDAFDYMEQFIKDFYDDLAGREVRKNIELKQQLDYAYTTSNARKFIADRYNDIRKLMEQGYSWDSYEVQYHLHVIDHYTRVADRHDK